MSVATECLILGAGLSGIAAGYWLGDKSGPVLERNAYPGGHTHTWTKHGFTWDEGPHIQFGRHPIAQEFFRRLGQSSYLERDAVILNYWRGHWIPHPAQVNLFPLPEEQRRQYVGSLLNAKSQSDPRSLDAAANYWEWLIAAYGEEFATDFPLRYTTKYWTVHPQEMSTLWLGPRMHLPTPAEIARGAQQCSGSGAHYLNRFIYPTTGGFMRFVEGAINPHKIELSAEVRAIDLDDRTVDVDGGRRYSYTSLINTIPLPEFIRLCAKVPAEVVKAANSLLCSELILVNVEVPHELSHKFHWCYVYDEDLLSTRITSYGEISPANVPTGQSGLQVEVYGSRRKPFALSERQIGETVVCELRQLGLVDKKAEVRFHTRYIKYANVVFDLNREACLEVIWSWLSNHGLKREACDLDYSPNWDALQPEALGSVIMAGRFAQWNYFWTHDCVLRARYLSECIGRTNG